MKTKFYAAKNFLKSTNQMWIANGREEQILLKIVEKKESGTEINLN
jgi:glutamate 5-kinase